jgi:hypothetical protein
MLSTTRWAPCPCVKPTEFVYSICPLHKVNVLLIEMHSNCLTEWVHYMQHRCKCGELLCVFVYACLNNVAVSTGEHFPTRSLPRRSRHHSGAIIIAWRRCLPPEQCLKFLLNELVPFC